jgi:hypothetical protein
MGKTESPDRPHAATGETNNISVDFTDVLDSGELLTGTPTIVEQDTSDLTITNVAVNTAALTINSRTVAIGMAIQGAVSGQTTTNSPYTLTVTASTDSTPAQTKVRYVVITVEDS